MSTTTDIGGPLPQHTAQHSAHPDSAPPVVADPPAFDDAAAAGDWALFQRRCRFASASPIIDAALRTTLKRRFCLAYLGSRAQVHGGVYMRSRPSVFTPAYVERMAADNAARRFERYPWLERLTALLQQLDQEQYQPAVQISGATPLPRTRLRLHIVANNVTQPCA